MTLALILEAAPVRSVEEAIGLMTRIDALLPDGDGVKWFNRLYLRVTENVAAALTHARIVGHLTGEASALAERSLIVAGDTLRDLADDGWERLLLSPAALARRSDPSGGWIGGAGRVTRRDGPDPFSALVRAR